MPQTPTTRPTRKRIAARTRRRIAQAARLAAEGQPYEAIGKLMHVSPRAIENWRCDHPEIWKADFRAAIDAVVDRVRQTAGTDAVLDDPDAYLKLATLADKWVMQQGGTLFPEGDEVTLSKFYADYYRPVVLEVTAPGTRHQYDVTVKRWRLLMGDPPLKAVTNELLAKFRDCLSRLASQDRVGLMSSSTVRSKLVQIGAILAKAGPAGPKCRDAAGIIDRVPWCRRPQEILEEPKIVPFQTLSDVYLAAVCMTKPRLDGVKAPKWWRALLAVAFNTGLRRGTLLALRWEWVDWQESLLRIPARALKSRRPMTMPLNETALEHLRSIRTDRELVFPWPYSREWFSIEFHRLQREAGVPDEQLFGLHALRRTAATTLWETSPQAAQLALGHASPLITRKHYVAQTAIVGRALATMPQPAAFGGGPAA